MVYTSDKDWYFVADFDSKNSYKRYAEDVYSPWTPQERYDRLTDANVIYCFNLMLAASDIFNNDYSLC